MLTGKHQQIKHTFLIIQKSECEIKHTSPLFMGFPISHLSKVLLWGTHSTGSPLCKKNISF